jgi:hypothetical protein
MASGSKSVGEMLADFRRLNDIPEDEAERASWICHLGPLSVRLPNFAWRKKAILAHDLHHLVTAYPCTLSGECRMAAWEFGAGRMPHWAARLFCLPLVLAGLVWSPRQIWIAFLFGMQSQSLHGAELGMCILSQPFDTFRAGVAQSGRRPGTLKACVVFAALIVEAGLMVALPAIAVTGLCLTMAACALS